MRVPAGAVNVIAEKWAALRVAHKRVASHKLPRAHGDAAQTAAIMQALAWGTRRPWITAAILGDAGDYDAATGLRAADGRVRKVVGVVARASRGLRDAAGVR